jgi:hypothetical protein
MNKNQECLYQGPVTISSGSKQTFTPSAKQSKGLFESKIDHTTNQGMAQNLGLDGRQGRTNGKISR